MGYNSNILDRLLIPRTWKAIKERRKQLKNYLELEILAQAGLPNARNMAVIAPFQPKVITSTHCVEHPACIGNVRKTLELWWIIG